MTDAVQAALRAAGQVAREQLITDRVQEQVGSFGGYLQQMPNPHDNQWQQEQEEQQQQEPTMGEIVAEIIDLHDEIRVMRNDIEALRLENARLRQSLEARGSSDINTGHTQLPKAEDSQDSDLNRIKEEQP